MKGLFAFLHHLFVPKENNNFRAKALHINVLTYYLLLALVISLALKTIPLEKGSVLGFATDITLEKLYQLTNEQRTKNNLSPLSFNEDLSEGAKLKAQDMFAKNYWSHYAADGKTPWDFILASGYQYEFAGENLAKNFLFSQGVIDAWMASPSHKENVLREDYTDVGFAVVNGVLNDEQTTLVVQMFGKPLPSYLAKAPTKPPQNETVSTQISRREVQSAQSKSYTLPFSFNLSLLFLLYLIVALLLDFYFASRLHIVRIGGKNLAHFIFVAFMLLGLMVLSKGAVL
ncbi:hypothetical protein HYW87_00975 [Candidatus Roizmanbacteria bacterium]|nr:hypothetical protein [Candidatus Roizmanbacteria bacterium]